VVGVEIPGWLKKVQENVAKSDIKPLFADEALVMGTIKASRTKEGIKKEANIRIAFIDMSNLKPIAKIVLSFTTAKGLVNALKSQIVKIEKELKSRERKEVKREPFLTYIG
jgi:hypothetical protein